MKKKTLLKTAIFVAAVIVLLFNACGPLREFGKSPIYKEANSFSYQRPIYDSSKKTIVIVANNDGTELFDMIAPFYLFNITDKANVYIVAKEKFPIVVKKGFFLLPQSTFSEIDSLKIRPDVMVIPFLNVADSLHQDPIIVKWIQKHYTPDVTVLFICDGAATAAATGLFDGKYLTAHASDYGGIKPKFSKPLWIQNTSVADNGNLLSTAGVSNATEGSLFVINKLFGSETMKKVIEKIGYVYNEPRMKHQSNTFHFKDKVAVGKKIFSRKNKKVGVLVQNGINEFELAAVMDTYNRTFPGSIESFSENNLPVKTMHGLTLIPTGKSGENSLDEVHIINVLSNSKLIEKLFRTDKIVRYDHTQKKYIIDNCLSRISDEYGQKFANSVKLMLDYN